MDIIQLVLTLYIVVLHIVASYLDVKSRLIPDLIWILAVPVCAYTLFSIVTSGDPTLQMLYLTDIIVGLVTTFLSLFLRLTGGADIKSLLVITFALRPTSTTGNVLKIVLDLPVIAVMLNSLVVVLLYFLYTLIHNLRTFKYCEDKVLVKSKLEKLLYFTSGVCENVRTVLTYSHRYSISYIVESGKIYFRYSLKVEDVDVSEIVKRLVESGVLRLDDFVYVTYYLPYIVCITGGLVLYLLSGGCIFTMLFSEG